MEATIFAERLAANKEWIFRQRPGPSGARATDFELRSCPMPVVNGDSVLMVKSYLFSVDPTIRNALIGPEQVSLTAQKGVLYYDFMNWALHECPTWAMIGTIVVSSNAAFPLGTMVKYNGGWRMYNAVDAQALQVLDPKIAPATYFSCLGGTGLAAYLPITHLCRPPTPGRVSFAEPPAFFLRDGL